MAPLSAEPDCLEEDEFALEDRIAALTAPELHADEAYWLSHYRCERAANSIQSRTGQRVRDTLAGYVDDL